MAESGVFGWTENLDEYLRSPTTVHSYISSHICTTKCIKAIHPCLIDNDEQPRILLQHL